MPRDVSTIEVRGFNETTTDDTIESFFENKKWSGGGEMKTFTRDSTNKVIRITYCNPTDAENVLGKPELKLEGATLSVSLVEEWDRRTIEVHGIHPSSSYDAIELFFESKRRSGGNTVEHMEFDIASNIAYVTFENPEVAATVLKTPLLLDGATLTVRPKSSISSRHQQTTGETDCNKEHESTSKVAATVLKTPLLLDIATLTARPKSSVSSRHQTTKATGSSNEYEATSEDLPRETPRKHDETLRDPQTPTRLPRDTPVEPPRHAARLVASRNMITVSGIKDTTTEELLKMFFQNKKRSDGGPVKDIDYRHTKGQATITFHSDEDAKRVLQCGVLSLEEAKLTITSMMVEETTPERECKPSQSCAFTDASSVHILEISGFKPGTGREIVEMFIENKTRETELQSLDYDTTTGVAVVALKNVQGTTQLETGNLQLGGVQLSVSALSHVCAGLDPESCRPRAIQVHGLCKNTSAETLELFFENIRACDGGDIEQLDYDDEEGTAVIVFKDADTASRVAQKKPLNLAGKPIHVKLMTPSASVPIVEGPFKDNLVLVSGLSPKCTGDDLETFFSAEKTHSEIQHVIFSLHPGVAMLQFTHPPEFDRLRELCVAKPLRGSMVNVQRVPQSKTIQVHNIGEITEEILNLYFENKCGRDGRVITVDVLRQNDYALVEFANCASAQNILARTSHQLENHRLFVSIYHTCLGLISPYHDTTMPGGWIPKNVFVTGFCPRVINFLQTYGVSRQLVNTKMTEVAAVVEWDTYNDATTCVELTCVITHRMKDAQTKAKTWSQDASKAFQDVLARNFVADKIETLQKAWTPFLERIGYVSDLDHSKIAVAVCAEECSVSITGPRKEVDSVSAKLKDDHSKVQEEMEKAAMIVTETKRGFTLHHLRMLNANAFKSQQEKKFADLTVEIDMASLEVRFTGMPGDITTAVSEMFGIFNNIVERCLKMSVSLISMLQGKRMMKLVVAQFRDQNICAVYDDVGDNRLWVYALSDEHVDTAIEVIKATTCKKSVAADVNKMSAPQKWIELIDAQQSEHDGFLTITESENTVVLVGEKSHVEDSLKEIHTFLEVNIISEQFVAMEHGVANYIDRYMSEEIKEVIKTFQQVTLTVKLDGTCGYVIAGNTNSVQRIVQDLQRWQDDIKMQQFPVDKPGLPKFLTSGPGQHSLQQLEQQHKVVIEPVGRYAQKGEELASDAGASAAGSSSMSRVTLPGGVTVEVIRGDLTKFHADAIVNAANVRLDHKRGLAKAIVHAGGQEIQRECLDYVHQWGGDIAEGNVYVSTSGSLPCKKVIHVVSPVWKGGRNSEEKMLYDAVYESLLTAEKHRLSSVALPALSSETGFPIAALTDTLVNALKDFLHAQSQSCVKKVSLVDLKDSVVRAFCMSLVPAFGPRKVVTGHGGQDKSQFSSSYYLMTGHDGQDKSQKKGARPTSHTDTRRQAQPLSGSQHTLSSGRHHVTTRREQTSAPRKTQLETPEGITLTLCKSEIVKEQVDAIVNSTNRSLQLNTGAVSRTLLKNGGNNIQTECQQNAPNGIQYEEVVVTSGGRLNCQCIVHGACPRWDGGGQSEQALRQFIANCLDVVHSMGLTSIAIPAIGTGKLDFPHQLVATAMLDELRKFSSYNPQTSLKDVRFVVYQKDRQTIKAFEDVLFSSETDLHRTASRPARALARHEEGAVGGVPIGSSSTESDEMIHIGSIDVDIVLGDLTHEQTDAIVNCTNRTLDLSKYATGRAIIQVGGQSIVQECKRLGRIGSDGITVTTAGQLPSSHIIHLDGYHLKTPDWTTIIESVLMEADSLQIESIAFPALGTGFLHYSPSDSANAMLDAFERFTKQNPDSCLKLVKIVIFQQSTMDSFRKQAFKKASRQKGWLRGMMSTAVDTLKSKLGVAEESLITRQHVTFNIFGKSHTVIKAAKKAMQQLCDKESTEVVLNNEQDQASIAKLTQTQVNLVRALQNKLDVNITIQKTSPDVCIRIQGRPVDTAQAQAQIVNIFRQVEHDAKEQMLASLIAKQIHWQFADGKHLTDYPKEINGLLESAFQSNKSHVEWKEIDGETYRVTFRTMKETSRRDRTGVDVKREDINDSNKLPSNWSRMGEDEHVKLEPLQPSSQEYKKVESVFMSTSGRSVNSVKKIERIQNPIMYRQYILRKEELTKRSKQPTAIERILWHGTNASAITSINNGGFNRSYCGKNATAYGQGVYFAVNVSYSASNTYSIPDANGLKHVYQACVLTGAYTTGDSSYRVAPPNPVIPGFPFDSVVDDISNPEIFVIFLDNQAYPEYLITFS